MRVGTQDPAIIRQEIDQLFSQGEVNLNLGCGGEKWERCINCDLYDERADRKLDARDLSEFGDDSVNAIYANNMLEHISFTEVPKMLKEWHRVLRDKGYLILLLPDMEKIIKRATEWMTSEWKDMDGNPAPETWVKIWNSTMKCIYGWQEAGEAMGHLWGYSPSYLACGLKELGFKIYKIYDEPQTRPTPNFMIIAMKNGKP